MSEVAHQVRPGAPKVDWDDLGRPRFQHLCGEVPVDQPLPLSASIVLNTVQGSIHCSLCRTSGYWVHGQWVSA